MGSVPLGRGSVKHRMKGPGSFCMWMVFSFFWGESYIVCLDGDDVFIFRGNLILYVWMVRCFLFF